MGMDSNVRLGCGGVSCVCIYIIYTYSHGLGGGVDGADDGAVVVGDVAHGGHHLFISGGDGDGNDGLIGMAHPIKHQSRMHVCVRTSKEICESRPVVGSSRKMTAVHVCVIVRERLDLQSASFLHPT